MAKMILVDVAPSGEIKIETQGFSGAECEAATAALEKALGSSHDNKRTSEFFKQPTTLKQSR